MGLCRWRSDRDLRRKLERWPEGWRGKRRRGREGARTDEKDRSRKSNGNSAYDLRGDLGDARSARVGTRLRANARRGALRAGGVRTLVHEQLQESQPAPYLLPDAEPGRSDADSPRQRARPGCHIRERRRAVKELQRLHDEHISATARQSRGQGEGDGLARRGDRVRVRARGRANASGHDRRAPLRAIQARQSALGADRCSRVAAAGVK